MSSPYFLCSLQRSLIPEDTAPRLTQVTTERLDSMMRFHILLTKVKCHPIYFSLSVNSSLSLSFHLFLSQFVLLFLILFNIFLSFHPSDPFSFSLTPSPLSLSPSVTLSIYLYQKVTYQTQIGRNTRIHQFK